MSAQAHATHSADTDSGTDCPASSSTDSSRTMGSTSAAPHSSMSTVHSITVLEQLKQQCRLQAARWGIISGGVLQVSQYSTVHLRFWSHENTYKKGIRWACVQLRPLDSSPQQEHGESQQSVTRVWSPELPRQIRTGSGSRPAANRAAHEGTDGPQFRGNSSAAGNQHCVGDEPQQQQQEQRASSVGPLRVVQQLIQYMGLWAGAAPGAADR